MYTFTSIMIDWYHELNVGIMYTWSELEGVYIVSMRYRI